MKGWIEKQIAGFCRIRGGKRLPEGHILQKEPTAYPYIKARDIRNGKVSAADLEYLSPATHETIKRYIVSEGDVCITIVANIGDVGLVPQKLHLANLTENAVRLTDFAEDVHSPYVNYCLSASFYKKYMETLAAGAAQSKLGIYKIEKIKVQIPPLPIQRKIAAVLSAYDDLIENNNRRIALLEKMGEELYREWFVRLRFPGHESTKIVKGVPEGWRVGQISDICSDVRSHVKLRNLDADSRYIGLEHITPNSMILKDHGCGGDVQSDKISFRPYDILFGKIRPYLEKVSITHFSGICSTDAIVLRPKSENLLGFTFLTVSSSSFLDLANTASKGTKMPRADWDFLAQQKIVLPPPDLQARFDSQFRPILSASIRYQSQTDNCCLARDRLLTRLMSGKIDLETLDIAFPPSMQEAA